MKKSTVSCPTACTNRNCKTCHVIDDEMVYSGLPNESTALMRVLPCKKSEIAKSTAFQNDPNKSTAWQIMQSLMVHIFRKHTFI